MTKYRLNKAENVPVTIYNVPKTKIIGGKAIAVNEGYIRLSPDVVYETDDKAMLNFFRTNSKLVMYSEQTESILKKFGVPYEIEYCKVCSGRVKKIRYKQVEVLDE